MEITLLKDISEDWRLTNQLQYLHGASLSFKQYAPQNDTWDHDHCEFCSRKFMINGPENTVQQGYATDDNYRWVCEKCFTDFKDYFEWA